MKSLFSISGQMVARRNFATERCWRESRTLAVISTLMLGGLLSAAPVGSSLTWRHLSSATGELPSPDGGKEQTSLLVLDLDRNKSQDIVIASRSVGGPALVALLQTKDGWRRLVIEPEGLPIAAGGAFCDIDGDGDADLVFGSSGAGNSVWWWENPGAVGDSVARWTRRAITTKQKGQHHDQLAGDFLGEGKPQVVSWYQGAGELVLFRRPQNPKQDDAWETIIVAANLKHTEKSKDNESSASTAKGYATKQPEGLAAGDIDGDGKLDIIGGGRWFKHLGTEQFATYIIDAAQAAGRTAVGDLKEGGHPEVVMVIGDGVGRLKWYECTGDPTEIAAWQGHDLLGIDVNHGHNLQIADFNNDGHMDVFCAEMTQWTKSVDNADSKAWVFLGDGRGNFSINEVANGFDFHESKAVDVDGDSRIDIVTKPFSWQTPRVDIWLNKAGTATNLSTPARK